MTAPAPASTAPGTRRGTALVTGLDVRAANGDGTEEFWRSLLEGRGGIGPITRFDASGYPSRLAGEIARDPGEDLPGRLLPQTDRVTQLALACAAEVLRDSGLDPAGAPEYGIGVVTANAAGGFEFGQRELENLWAKGPLYVSAYQSFAWFYAVNTGQISIRHGLRGPSGVLVTGQSGGLDAVGHARRMLRKGTPAVLTGAMESALCPWGHVAELTGGRLSTADRSENACLPFGERAAGHVVAEGGALLMLEDAASAHARGGIRPYGEVAGYAACFDPPRARGGPPARRGPRARRWPTREWNRRTSARCSPREPRFRISTRRRPGRSPRSSGRTPCRSPRSPPAPGARGPAPPRSTSRRRCSPSVTG